MNEKELIEHTIVIDEYITATIKIPKILTALELAALMTKARKMFNISEVMIEQPQQPKKIIINRKKSNNIYLAPEQEQELLNTFNLLTSEEKDRLAIKFGYSDRRKLLDKYHNIKLKYKNKKIIKSKKFIWTSENVDFLKKNYRKIIAKKIAEKLGITKQSVYDKIWVLRKNGELK